jgi:hypothetical protein
MNPTQREIVAFESTIAGRLEERKLDDPVSSASHRAWELMRVGDTRPQLRQHNGKVAEKDAGNNWRAQVKVRGEPVSGTCSCLCENGSKP